MGFRGQLFEVGDDLLGVIQSGFDDSLAFFAKDCTLVFAGGAPASSNNPWDGGGHAAEDPTEGVRLMVAWDERDFWVRLPANVKFPDGVIQTKGFVTDLDRVMRASFLLVDGPLAAGQRAKFERAGDPTSPFKVIQDRYFLCNWARVG